MTDESDLLLLRESYKASLALFCEGAFSILNPGVKYHNNWHMDVMCQYLMAAYRREIKRLIINVPPRTGKSLYGTIGMHAWMMGHDPRARIVAASYSKDLANNHNRSVQALLNTAWYKNLFPQLIVERANEDIITTSQFGHRVTASVGSSLTGKGGNFITIDDPLNPDEASSKAERTTANEWFGATLSSRLDDPANDVIVVIMQRLHEDDLTGFLLDQGGWEHLCLPSENKGPSRTYHLLDGTKKIWKPKELLHPARLSAEVLDMKRREMGSLAFAGQYEQQPVPDEGGMIKRDWWQLWKGKAPEIDFILQVYDTAFTEKEENDACARTTWGIFTDDDGQSNIILLDVFNERVEYHELRVEALRSYQERKPDLVMIEEKANGLVLIQDFKRMGLRVKGIPRNRTSKDKRARVQIASVLLEQGCVWVPCDKRLSETGKEIYFPKKYAEEVILQCSLFPYGKHDDIVDTVADALTFLRSYKGIGVPDDKEDEVIHIDKSKKPRYYG